MGGAIASGIVASHIADAGDVLVSHARPSYVEKIKAMGYEPHMTNDNIEAVRGAGMVFLAVKPWKALEVIREIAPYMDSSSTVIA